MWFQNRRMKWRHMESKERREQERQAAANAGAKASSSTTSLMSSISNTSILARSLPPNAADAGRFGHPSSSNPFLPSSSSSIGINNPNPGRNPMMYFDDDNDDDTDDEDEDENVPRLVMNADSTGDPEIKVD